MSATGVEAAGLPAEWTSSSGTSGAGFFQSGFPEFASKAQVMSRPSSRAVRKRCPSARIGDECPGGTGVFHAGAANFTGGREPGATPLPPVPRNSVQGPTGFAGLNKHNKTRVRVLNVKVFMYTKVFDLPADFHRVFRRS